MRIASLLPSLMAPALIVLVGCPDPIYDKPVDSAEPADTADSGEIACDDSDTDGDCDDVDCAPNDAATGPSAAEICDELDNNCNGEIDEDVINTYFIDADFDGFGDPSASKTACAEPAGYTTNSADCNDDDDDAYPGSPEVCDGVDNDCNELIDDDAPFSTWYRDADDDGYGDATQSEVACFASTGFVADATDCDDSNPTTFPDSDEVCNTVDDDCDGEIDEYGAIDGTIYYEDADNDGYGGRSISLSACDGAPAGYVLDSSDCNDGDSAQSPGSPEYCNNLDDDCDAEIDEGEAVGAPEWYLDADGDGYPGAISTIAACAMPADAFDYVDDCDDTSADVSPAGAELCNGVDDNCNTEVDEGATADGVVYYLDADFDGFAGDDITTTACNGSPEGYFADAEDCDDTNFDISPSGTELCNTVDDNCDGAVDEDSAADAQIWYYDTDGDGYAGTTSTTKACSIPADAFETAEDCDDGNPDHSPATAEICDGIDNSCEGLIDESFVAVPAEYATIQQGIDAAVTGDTVCVASGTFVEDISFRGKGITVTGQGVGSTVLEGTGLGSVVQFVTGEGADSILQSLTVQGGASASDGAGIYVSAASPTLWDLEIANNSCENRTRCRGVGLFLFDSEATLTDVEVHSNYSAPSSSSPTALVTGSGAGIYAALSGGNWENVSVHDNQMQFGANGVQPGEALAGGGGIYVTIGTITASAVSSSNNTIEQLSGSYDMESKGGGLFVTGGANTFSDWVVDQNTIDMTTGGSSYGGGIYVEDDDSTFSQALVTSNSADGYYNFGSGIGIYLRANPTFTNLVLADNEVTSDANIGYGAMWVYHSNRVSITNADIYANRGEASSYSRAGGIYSEYQSDLLLVNVAIVENVASYGGAISTDGTGSTKILYGSVYGNSSPEFFGVSAPDPGDGNITEHPSYTSTSGAAVDWDFTLIPGSYCIDAGDPSIFDVDGSVSDIGSQGGPGGSW